MGTTADKAELDPRSSCFLYTGRLLIDDLRELVVLPVLDQGDLLLVQLTDFFGLIPAFLAPAPALLINL